MPDYRMHNGTDSSQQTYANIANEIIEIGVNSLTDSTDLLIQNGEITGVQNIEAENATVSGQFDVTGSLAVEGELTAEGGLTSNGDIEIADLASGIVIANPEGFRMGTTTNNGYVLTVDSVGNASWEAPFDGYDDTNAANKNVYYATLDDGVYNLALIPDNQTPDFGGGRGVIFIGDCREAPTTNPSNGGILFSQNGELWWRGSNGTLSNLASS